MPRAQLEGAKKGLLRPPVHTVAFLTIVMLYYNIQNKNNKTESLPLEEDSVLCGNNISGVKEIAQLAKCLPYKHENLQSVPRTYKILLNVVAHTCSLNTREVDQMGP